MTAEQIKEAAPKAATATAAAPKAATAAPAAPVKSAPVQKEADPADDIGLIQPMGVEQ